MQVSADQHPHADVEAPDIDPISLRVQWNRLISIMDEADIIVLRSAFSTIVSDSRDYAVILLDREGYGLAQANVCVPSFTHSLPRAARSMLELFPADTLVPGDVLFSNDPWLCHGHLPDFFVVTPIFCDGRLAAFYAAAAHISDIGGRLDELTARDVYEEGLRIPPTKLYAAGVPNRELLQILRANVRYPDMVLGDLETMVGAGRLVASRYGAYVADYGQASADAAARAIHNRSDAAMRRAISAVPDGVYLGETTADGYLQPTHIQVAIIVDGDRMSFDYTGSSPQRMGASINCVLNVTVSHSLLALKCALLPDLPNNEGLYRCVTVTAPDGCILNPRFPAPVRGRSMTSFNLNAAIYAALAPVLPHGVAAASGSMWWITIAGNRADGRAFAVHLLPHGGRGALAGMDGPCTMAFPSNGTITPAEIVENQAPVLLMERSLRVGSGGDGAYRGGLGQTIRIRALDDRPLRMTVRPDKLKYPAKGMLGGKPGALGALLMDGAPMKLEPFVLEPGQELTLSTPGGGGFGDPATRDPDLRQLDLAMGYTDASA